MLGVVAFIIGLVILKYVFKRYNDELESIRKLEKTYNKAPLDLRILILLISWSMMDGFINKVSFFYKPYDIKQIFNLSIVAFYIFYYMFNMNLAIKLKRNKEEFRSQLKNCLFYKLYNFKIRGIITLTALFGVSVFIIFIKLMKPSILLMIPIVYMLCYVFFMFISTFKKMRAFNNIIKGTEEIVSGNLNYTIEEKGGGDFLKLAHNINSMRARFKESLENEIKSERLKSELITNVSHDLKTPLTSIINYVDLLKKEDISKEEEQSYIEVLDKKSQRLKILIDDLFEASKLASGAVEFNIEKIDVISLLQQTLAELDENINNSSLIFKLEVPEEKVYANLDGKKTWRVFENLINNVLKYALSETRVYIELISQDSKIIITMKNISSYEMDFDKEEIFDRFKRGDMSRNTEGSGLGLSIARNILELQGGSLSIDIDGDLFKATVEIPLLAS